MAPEKRSDQLPCTAGAWPVFEVLFCGEFSPGYLLGGRLHCIAYRQKATYVGFNLCIVASTAHRCHHACGGIPAGKLHTQTVQHGTQRAELRHPGAEHVCTADMQDAWTVHWTSNNRASAMSV